MGLLLTGEVCVCHIHESLGIPQPKASRHLAYLRRVGLVVARREGLWAHYRLASLPEPVLDAIIASVRHALTHVSDVHRDIVRLQKKTGCGLPSPDAPRAACCADVPSVSRATAAAWPATTSPENAAGPIASAAEGTPTPTRPAPGPCADEPVMRNAAN